jgi:hypothetical protein
MTRTDLQILYTALAYIAVYLKEPQEAHKAEPAIILAAHIEEYCRKNVENAFPPNEVHFVSDGDANAIDKIIDKHVQELRHEESTILPQDRQSLLTIYDRLQQRKAHRMQATFYQTVHDEFLADSVRRYLDEEIADAEASA